MYNRISVLVVGLIFTHSLYADYSKEELLINVANAIGKCRELVAEIDKKPESLWSPKLGILDTSKKSKLAEIAKRLSFQQYLDYINDLKVKNGTTKARLDKTINGWSGDLHKLTMTISEDLRAFSSFCAGPVKVLKADLVALEKLK